MATLWSQTSTFENVSIGDDLPILVKFEFRMPVPNGAGALAISPLEEPVSTEKLDGYVKELLLKGFSQESVNHEHTSIETLIETDFLPGDTVSLSGRVVEKLDDGGGRRVQCQITVESQEGAMLASGHAEVSF